MRRGDEGSSPRTQTPACAKKISHHPEEIAAGSASRSHRRAARSSLYKKSSSRRSSFGDRARESSASLRHEQPHDTKQLSRAPAEDASTIS